MFLQKWIEHQIRETARQDADFARLMAKRNLDAPTRDDLEAFQLFRLSRALNHAYERSSFYGELFNRAGAKPGDIKSLADLARLPLTDSSALAASPYRFLCVSRGAVERAYTLSTAGTTGAAKKLFFTEKDIERISDYMGAAMKTVAMLSGMGSEGYTVFVMLPNSKPESQAHLLARGVEKYSARPATSDLTLGSQEQIEAIARVSADIIFGSTSRIHRMTQEGRGDLARLEVKVLFATSEYLPPAMRGKMERAWGAKVYLHYGMTEMGFGGGVECTAHHGFHFNEADFLFEVVDPESGEALPKRREGELVFTTLGREGMPLVRYRSGDLSRLLPGPCSCGASILERIGPLRRRVAAEALLGGGEEVYPALFDDALYSIPGLVDYRVSLTTVGSRVGLRCHIEAAGASAQIEEEVRRALTAIPPLHRNLASGYLTGLDIELVPPGTLKRAGRGKQRISDLRQQA